MAKNNYLRAALCGIVLLAFHHPVLAKKSTVDSTEDIPMVAPNALYGEFGGNCLLGSINYDRKLSDSYALRAGFAPLAIFNPRYDYFIATFLANTLFGYFVIDNNVFFGRALHDFQIGVGVTMITGYRPVDFGSFSYATGSLNGNTSPSTDYSHRYTYFLPTASLSYRYQPQKGGVMVQFSFTPLLFFSNGDGDLDDTISLF